MTDRSHTLQEEVSSVSWAGSCVTVSEYFPRLFAGPWGQYLRASDVLDDSMNQFVLAHRLEDKVIDLLFGNTLSTSDLWISNDDINTTLTSGLTCRTRLVTSKPDIPGMRMSERTRPYSVEYCRQWSSAVAGLVKALTFMLLRIRICLITRAVS